MRLLALQAIEQIPMECFTGKDVFTMLRYLPRSNVKRHVLRFCTPKQISQVLHFYSTTNTIDKVGILEGEYGGGSSVVYARKDNAPPIYTSASETFCIEVLMEQD